MGRLKKVVVVMVVVLGAGLTGLRAQAAGRLFTEAGIGGGVMCDIDLPGDRLWGASVVGQLGRRLWQGQGLGVDLRLEGVGTYYWGKTNAWLGGATVGLRLCRQAAPMVFAETAVGPSWNNLDIEEIGSSFNFLLYGGVGLRVKQEETRAVDIALRVRHISNAGMTDRNHGLTSLWVVVSFSWQL